MQGPPPTRGSSLAVEAEFTSACRFDTQVGLEAVSEDRARQRGLTWEAMEVTDPEVAGWPRGTAVPLPTLLLESIYSHLPPSF